nr:reverse transcriptase domain-containing protein [Tanacetum cinerariifolium]
MLNSMRHQVNPLFHEVTSMTGRNRDFWQTLLEQSRQREFPSIDEPEPQPLPNLPFLDVNPGDKRGPKPPIKPISPDSFRMKVVDHLTIHRLPSSYVASFYPKEVYCYYHPCLDDPKKHYGFKIGLLRQRGSLGVDLSKLEMIDDDWKLESKKGSYLGDGLDLPNELGKGGIKETHHLKHVVQQTLFQYMAPNHHSSVYHYYHPHLTLSVGESFLLTVNGIQSSDNLKMSRNEDHHRQGRRFAAEGNGYDGRDPRDVEIERLRQRVRDLEIQHEIRQIWKRI